MCVANLKVSTQPCNHRWAQMIRPCQSWHNLANCPERLKLEGWETRVDFCPFCEEDEAVNASTHRLFTSSGNNNNNASVYGSSYGASSSSSGPASPDLVGTQLPTRAHRSGSMGTISSLTRQSSTSSGDVDRGQWHREMNDRLLRYMTSDPQEVLPSARRNYPAFSSTNSSYSPSAREESNTSDAASIKSSTSKTISQVLKRGVRFGRIKT